MGTAAAQGAIWGARAADWAAFNEPAWDPIFRTALEKARVAAGCRVLDIGCGAGGALAVARALGAEVAGLDAAANLVAIARRRLPGVQIEIGDMEELPFADRTFDVATAINSIQFGGNLVGAIAEARRVLRDGGTMTMVVWGKREDCELVSGTASAVFSMLPPNPDARPPVPLASGGTIESLMREAGLRPRASGEFPGDLIIPDVETAVRAVLSASARAIEHAGEAAVADAIRKTLPQFMRADGSVRWRNRFRWVSAVRDGQ